MKQLILGNVILESSEKIFINLCFLYSFIFGESIKKETATNINRDRKI